MADDKDLDINLDAVLGGQGGDDNFTLDDAKDAGLDEFLDDAVFDNRNAGFVNASASKEDEPAGTDELAELGSGAPLDFASFDIDDFDAALNSFQAARAGKLPRSVPMPPPAQSKPQPKPKAEPKPETEPAAAAVPAPEAKPEPEIVREPEAVSVPEVSKQNFEIEREEVSAPVADTKVRTVQTRSGNSGLFNPATVDESSFKENSAERQQDILNWYSGTLKDKTYEISPEKMPEFLDTDKTIRVLHVTVDSTYGWNVFFDNGVFMSLRDLKEYQERHGEILCQDGKIIYGSKTTSFERILRVVVYERPRYFSYVVK